MWEILFESTEVTKKAKGFTHSQSDDQATSGIPVLCIGVIT